MSMHGEKPATQTTSSRRALMAGALGGLGALAAAAIGMPRPAQAQTGDALKLGLSNSAGTITTLTRLGSDRLGNALKVVVSRSSAVAVKALASGGTGVDGTATSGIGVAGHSSTGVGVFGTSVRAQGVWASSELNTALFARSLHAAGIHAIGGGAQGVIGNGVIGVEGNSQARHGLGVSGVSTALGRHRRSWTGHRRGQPRRRGLYQSRPRDSRRERRRLGRLLRWARLHERVLRIPRGHHAGRRSKGQPRQVVRAQWPRREDAAVRPIPHRRRTGPVEPALSLARWPRTCELSRTRAAGRNLPGGSLSARDAAD